MATAAEDLLEWARENCDSLNLNDWEELNGLIGAVMSEARQHERFVENERLREEFDQARNMTMPHTYSTVDSQGNKLPPKEYRLQGYWSLYDRLNRAMIGQESASAKF